MNNNKIIEILKPYILMVCLSIFVVYLFKTVESFTFWKYQDSVSFLAIFQSFFNITAVFCLYSLVILPFYFLIGLWKHRIAQICASLLFAIFFLLEIGLFIYYKRTGVLMGAELLARPFNEILTTIRNSSNTTFNILAIVLVITFFIAAPFFLKKIKVFNQFLSIAVGILIVGVLSLCTIFYQRDTKQQINHYLETKSYYFFSAAKEYSVYEESKIVENIEKNDSFLKAYFEIFPDRTIPDMDYPMERPSSEIPDVLSPFLEKSEKQPHIVIVIVESLGSYIMGEKGKGVTFTPFLDSLASVSLYWKNCLSLTGRTFGVVPSVIGSVPHGMIGFQFGVMPKHHSLFSILKKNDYSTHFFYGGDASFDNMLDFLTAQDPDHIDNFMPELKTYQKRDQANYWSLYDHILFKKSFEFLKTVPPHKPNVNVYLTLTSHEPFGGGDKELNKIYEPRTEKIFSKLEAKYKKNLLPVKNIIVPFTYVDDCMRNFMNQYSKQPEFENTIFIITGDHSYGYHKNDLAYHSVPLIIWSPLLKTPKIFPNIVSHLSITPSVISFLQNSYGIKTPELVAWCSDGLDTATVFNPTEKILFLSYARQVNVMAFNQYYFINSSDELYEIDENLDLKPIKDPLLFEKIRSKFKTLKYVNNYVYHNDKLVKNDNRPSEKYKILKRYENNDVTVCKTPDTIPSIHGIDTFDLMPVQKIENIFNKIKIRFEADLLINDYVYQDMQMMLNFICKGNNFKYESKENITKYVVSDHIQSGETYRLQIEKEINVKDINNISVHICVTTNEYDYNWLPDKKISFSNTKVLILGK